MVMIAILFEGGREGGSYKVDGYWTYTQSERMRWSEYLPRQSTARPKQVGRRAPQRFINPLLAPDSVDWLLGNSRAVVDQDRSAWDARSSVPGRGASPPTGQPNRLFWGWRRAPGTCPSGTSLPRRLSRCKNRCLGRAFARRNIHPEVRFVLTRGLLPVRDFFLSPQRPLRPAA